MSGVPYRTLRLVLDRAQGRCERCDSANVADIHHRRARGMGGTRDPEIHAPANLVVLCRDCHTFVEHNRAEATEQGWLVPRRDPRDPADVPVYVDIGWYMVTPYKLQPVDLNPPF